MLLYIYYKLLSKAARVEKISLDIYSKLVEVTNDFLDDSEFYTCIVSQLDNFCFVDVSTSEIDFKHFSN